MTTNLWRLAFVALLPLIAAGPSAADDPYSNTPYYEEEPWYDITEWFDGDDYRRTDYDEETTNDYDNADYDYDYGYHYDADGTLDYGTHYDTVSAYDSAYGYDNTFTSDDWFYDYWDNGYSYYRDGDSDGFYEYATVYRDYDGDGYYDAYLSYNDWDSDGFYEDIDYYTFNETGENSSSDEAKQGSSMKSKARRTQGKIAKVKKVKVRGDKHLLVRLDGGEGKQSTVDLGPASALSDYDISEGVELSATGPVIKAGDKRLLVADSAKIDGESFKPNRNQQQIRGEIVSTREFTNRGTKHRLVTIKTDEGKKVLVDLGPKDKLDIELAKKDKVMVEGAPVKANGKRMLLAHRVKHDGESATIDRRSGSRNDGSKQASRNQDQRDSSGKKAMKSPSFSGEVASTRKVKVRGKQRQLVVLNTDSGTKMLVDLGPANQLDMSCRPGDQCRVCGPVVKAKDGRPVVLCRMLVVEKGEPNRIRAAQASDNKLREVTGDIRSLATVKVRGNERQLAHLKTDEGEKLIVDLGAPDKLPMDINKGEQLSAKGQIVKANDKLILVAYEASLEDGESHSIDR